MSTLTCAIFSSDLQQCKDPATATICSSGPFGSFQYCFLMVTRFSPIHCRITHHSMHQLQRQLQGPALQTFSKRTFHPVLVRPGGVAPRIFRAGSSAAGVEFAGEGISAEQVAKFDAIAARLVDAADRLPEDGELGQLRRIVVSKGSSLRCMLQGLTSSTVDHCRL
jgi:hypothetical protein